MQNILNGMRGAWAGSRDLNPTGHEALGDVTYPDIARDAEGSPTTPLWKRRILRGDSKDVATSITVVNVLGIPAP